MGELNQIHEEREAAAIRAILDKHFQEGEEREAMEDVLVGHLDDIQGSLNDRIREAKEQLENLTGAREKIDYLQTDHSDNVGLVTYVGDSGQYETKRFTGNEGWYSDFYKKNKRAPTQRDCYDIAYEETMEEIEHTDDPEAKEMGEALKGLMTRLETLESLTERVKEIDKEELMAHTLLDDEAFQKVYKPALDALRAGNAAVNEAARDSAIIMAKTAEIFHETYGTPYEDFARIAVNGRVGEGVYGQPVTADIDENAMYEAVDFDSLTDEIQAGGETPADIQTVLDYINNSLQDVTVPTSDLTAILDMRGIGDGVNANHVVKAFSQTGRRQKNKRTREIRNKTLSNFYDVLSHAILVEYQPGNQEKAGYYADKTHDKKATGTMRFVVPITFDGQGYGLVITAQNFGKEISLKETPATVYEIYDRKVKDARPEKASLKPSVNGTRPEAAPPAPGTEVDGTRPETASPAPGTETENSVVKFRLADILANVKDLEGKPYVNEYGVFNRALLPPVFHQMAGERAATANHEKLRRARAMEEEGKMPEEIWKETGWLRGKDDKWRFEIPDNLDDIDFSKFKINWEGIEVDAPDIGLQELYDNKPLYEAYPQLGGIRVVKRDLDERMGGYVEHFDGGGRAIVINEKQIETAPEEAKRALIHELQHVIQDTEGFAVGGNPESARRQMQRELSKERKAAEKLFPSPNAKAYYEADRRWMRALFCGDTREEAYYGRIVEAYEKEGDNADTLGLTDDILGKLNKLYENIERLDERLGPDGMTWMEDFRAYQDLAGEQEARATAVRAKGQGVESAAKLERDRFTEIEAKQSPAGKALLNKLYVTMKRAYKEENLSAEEERWLEEQYEHGPAELRDAAEKLAFAEGWAEQREERASMPHPHDDNAIVVFGGEELPYSAEPYYQTMGDIAEAKLTADEKTFAQRVDDFHDGKLKGVANVRVMDTPLALTLAGAKLLPVEIKTETMAKILTGKHNYQMDEDILKQIPRALTDPAAIFFSDTQPGPQNIVVALELEDKNGAHIVVPFRLEENSNQTDPKTGYVMNLMTSAYGKDNGDKKNPKPRNEWFLEQLDHGNLKYVNEKKLPNLFGTDGRLLARSSEKIKELRSSMIIRDQNDLVKLWNENPNLYQGDQHIGAYDPSQNIIALFNGANQSTLVHETAHMWLTMLQRVAQQGNEKAAKDLDTIYSWASYSRAAMKEYKGTELEKEFAGYAKLLRENPNDLAAQDRFRQERFARGFERYLMTGSAPTKELHGVFRHFKKWLLGIYRDLMNLGKVDPPEEIRRIFDHMLATQQEIDAWAENINGLIVTSLVGYEYWSEVKEFLRLVP